MRLKLFGRKEYFKVWKHVSQQKGMELCCLPSISPGSDLDGRNQSASVEQRSGMFLLELHGRRHMRGSHLPPTTLPPVAEQGALANRPDIPSGSRCVLVGVRLRIASNPT